MNRLFILILFLALFTGCTPASWPDRVLPEADSRAALPDEVMKQADAGSRFNR